MRIHCWRALLAPLLLMLSGCAGLPWGGGDAVPDGTPRSFASPEDAVRQVSRFLEARDWRRLAEYYDLQDGSESRSALVDGSYFVRPFAPSGEEVAARQWRPFYPGSEFSHVNPTEDEDVVEVVVEYETEAEGGLRLRGYDSFRMRRSTGGWRLLPD